MKKILVVDDEVHTRLLYKELFTDGEYHVVTASDGLEALRCIRDEKPDLVILDIRMPGIDGLEVLERSHEFNDSLPFIICTAARNLKEDPNVKASNVKALLTKPVDIGDLKEKVEKFLREV
jgi:two-component system response regulator (stage 0 sporulation protein F)